MKDNNMNKYLTTNLSIIQNVVHSYYIEFFTIELYKSVFFPNESFIS